MKKSSKISIAFNICLVFMLIHIRQCAQSQLSSVVEISDELPCTETYKKYVLPTIGSSQYFVFSLNVITSNGLPIVMTVFQNEQQHMNFNVNSLAGNEIDSQALQKNKKQVLQYQPAFNSSAIYVSILRLSLQQFPFANNIDRPIQHYQISNPSQLSSCKIPINFTISVSRYITSNPNLTQSNLTLPPLSPSDCLRGYYSQAEQVCNCQDGFGMPLCDINFTHIPSCNVPRSSYLRPNDKEVYYFQAITGSPIDIQVAVKGVLSGPYSFSNDKPTQFTVLMLIQSVNDPLVLPTMFNQMNPLSIEGLSLKNNERLVITVYKPGWASAQPYQITINVSNNILQQLIIIIIAVCCAITFLAIFGFILYLVHYRRRYVDELVGAVPIRRHNSKVVNQFLIVDRHFPTLTFAELTLAIQSTQKQLISSVSQQLTLTASEELQKTTCAICLDSFNSECEVKLAYCGHIFNSSCLRQWMSRQPSCPLCRFEFNGAATRIIEIKLGLTATSTPFQKCMKIWKELKTSAKDVRKEKDIQATPNQQNQPGSSYQLNNFHSQHHLN